ncbi:hypothetical protein GDO78_004019 [Eleutherodactylus coqui]|uniref:Uncharacterized protein n=1 Tax=Eleutherodactylus coqui TaxID=57060 RepID=A0A8J6JZP0_ELECQ|nr:hypothetical protein GDO78_004019 [Eleutherodactylus coqui]
MLRKLSLFLQIGRSHVPSPTSQKKPQIWWKPGAPSLCDQNLMLSPPPMQVVRKQKAVWELSPGALYLGPSKVQSSGACTKIRSPLGLGNVLKISLKTHPRAKMQVSVSHPCCKTS